MEKFSSQNFPNTLSKLSSVTGSIPAY